MSLMTEALLDDTNIFIPVNPDFMDNPDAYLLSMSFPENRMFYRKIRDNAMKEIIAISIRYGYTDYVVSYNNKSAKLVQITSHKNKTIKSEKKHLNDFIMMQTTDIRECIRTKCTCINAALIFLFKLKQHIFDVLVPKYEEEESEIKKILTLSDNAIARILYFPHQEKMLRKKSKKFIARAEELNSDADVSYYTIELIKRIYLRELHKIVACYVPS